jgi:hypothetical protein
MDTPGQISFVQQQTYILSCRRPPLTDSADGNTNAIPFPTVNWES